VLLMAQAERHRCVRGSRYSVSPFPRRLSIAGKQNRRVDVQFPTAGQGLDQGFLIMADEKAKKKAAKKVDKAVRKAVKRGVSDTVWQVSPRSSLRLKAKQPQVWLKQRPLEQNARGL
jgi:hypothetical protein